MHSELTVDGLAQEIRRVDGSHSLGAGALAEALMPFLAAALSDQERAVEVRIKPLEFNDDPCPAAACAFGHYVINPIYSDVELLIGYGRMSMTGLGRVQLNSGASIDDLRCAAQADYEQRIRSALVDVPVEPVNDDLIGYVMRYGGMCRDCADMDGVCQSGQPCDTGQRRAVVKHTISALAYGIKHGFIASPFQSPHREGEDSAEVERLTRPILGIEHRTAQEAFDIMANRIRRAATRSDSASTASGGRDDG